jgi:hypothetical protein
VDWDRRNAAAPLARSPETLTDNEKNTIRTLAASSGALGQILRDQSNPECVQPLTEQYELNSKIGDTAGAAIAAFNLGHAYMQLPALRDLDEAERWYQRILELVDKDDHLGQGKGNYCLGHVAYERFKDARKANAPQAELLKHLNAAVAYYQQALALLPPDAVDDIATTNWQLGFIFAEAGDLERGLNFWQAGINLFEKAGNLFEAGKHQRNISIFMVQADRISDGLLYARAALRNFEPYGQGAADVIQKTQGLIAEIEQAMKGKDDG